MPQIVVKNVSRDKTALLAPALAEKVVQIIQVPKEHIVVEYSQSEFFRGGVPDTDSAMVWVYWKKRTPRLQKAVAEAIAPVFKEIGYSTVEVVYCNLDMNDFYEFK